jgi:predicted deacylase
MGPGKYEVVIRPENTPINDSPWFAFKVSAVKPTSLVIHLTCDGGTLRYRPKISMDGEQWVMLPAECYEQATQRKEAELKLEVGPQALWVAAQEPVSTLEMWSWARTLERLPFVSVSEYGSSLSGQKLCRIDIGDGRSARHVSVIGRQHPPETTGSLALMRFIEEICGDSESARKFREEFHVAVMPLVNPDGVDAGNWRHSLGRTDLNRDWGPFAQPETRATSEQIAGLAKSGRLYLHLDFHSTFHDVFYTQPDDEPASPEMFAARWLEGLQKRVPDYHVNREASRTPKPTTSAYWAHKTFGIPGITYEIGDNTDRAQLKQVAAAAAQEMMDLLLKVKDEPPKEPQTVGSEGK